MPVVSAAQLDKAGRDPLIDAHVLLLEFAEDGSAVVHRAAVNTEDVTHKGEVYGKAPFQVVLPSSGSGDVRAQIEIPNVDRVIGRALDSARARINVRLILVDSANLDVAIVDTKNLLVMPRASGNSERLSAELGPRATLQEPVPSRKTSKASFPGVWI